LLEECLTRAVAEGRLSHEASGGRDRSYFIDGLDARYRSDLDDLREL
jgi:hypothetical protein